MCRDLAAGQPNLGHAVALAQRDRAVVEALAIDCQASGSPDLVLAPIAAANRRRFVVNGHESSLEIVVDLSRRGDELRLPHDRQDRHLLSARL